MKKIQVIRQGDVILIPIKNLPKNLELIPEEKGNIILAYGEVTGHSHAIASGTAALFRSEGKEFLNVKKESILKHQEHGPITLSPGYYEKRIAREYSPAGIRQVQD